MAGTVKGKCRLFLGDCREVLCKVPDLSVDAVLADPPFGIGFKYDSFKDESRGYGKWLWQIIEVCERKCKPGSPIFVWQAMPNVTMFAKWFPRKYRLFAAAKNFVQMRPSLAMQFAWDPVIVWWTDGEPWTRGRSNRDFHLANSAALVARPQNLERKHPCPRPIGQLFHIVDNWVRPGGTVLDPFMGSGTTGIACYRTARSFVGIEIERCYFDLAVERIEREGRAPTGFFGSRKWRLQVHRGGRV